jgi:hypothetical protein
VSVVETEILFACIDKLQIEGFVQAVKLNLRQFMTIKRCTKIKVNFYEIYCSHSGKHKDESILGCSDV